MNTLTEDAREILCAMLSNPNVDVSGADARGTVVTLAWELAEKMDQERRRRVDAEKARRFAEEQRLLQLASGGTR